MHVNYFSDVVGLPVIDSDGVRIGNVTDLGIASGDVFPRVMIMAYKGPTKTPFMINWRRMVKEVDETGVVLTVPLAEIRFSYLQPNEVLIARDLMGKQIVNTQTLKVETVYDVKFSHSSRQQLRLLGVEVGLSGALRNKFPFMKKIVNAVFGLLHIDMEEHLVAWNSLDLIDRNLSNVKLSVNHRRLDELHPADVADVIEQLDTESQPKIFEQLEDAQASEVLTDLNVDALTNILSTLSDSRVGLLLAPMDPDDITDILENFSRERQESVLRALDNELASNIRELLGYESRTAGGIMTTEYVALYEGSTVAEAISELKNLAEEHEEVNYIYTLDAEHRLSGYISLQRLATAEEDTVISEIAETDIITASPDDDQEDVATTISKYDLIALPVIDEDNMLIGIVTVDDAFEVFEEERDEDLKIASGATSDQDHQSIGQALLWFMRHELWFIIWVAIAATMLLAHAPLPYIAALLPMPLVLSVADNSITYARNRVIEYPNPEEEPPRTRPLLGRNAIIGLILGVFIAILVIASDLLPLPDSFASSLTIKLSALAAGLTIVAIVITSTFITRTLIKMIGQGNEPSRLIPTIIMLIGSTAFYLILLTVFFSTAGVI